MVDYVKKEIEVLNFGLKMDLTTIQIDGPKSIISTLNPHSYCLSKKDKHFETALRSSDILLPDGVGIVWAAKVLKKENISKIAGYDIFLYIMEYLNKENGSCFFMGASESTLFLIKERAKKEYPNVKVLTYSPPFKEQFTLEENNNMCSIINETKPDVLFVGMTAPKQEKWVHEHKDRLSPFIICSIGAVFDFYAGTVKRASPFWIKLGLEWLPRFIKEPIRLAQRNLVSTPKFIFEVFCFKLFGKGFL